MTSSIPPGPGRRCLGLAIGIAGLLLCAAPAGAQTKAIRFGQLWDGSRLVKDALVVVEGDRVVRVEAGGRVPEGAESVDLRRYTGLPGLIDLHTHITYYWDRNRARPLGQRRRAAVTVFLAQDNARRTLETGVTTVRDLGASGETDFAMRDLIAMGAMTGPRMFVAGQGMSAGAGDTRRGRWRNAEDRIKAGSDWVKVYGSRGSFDSVETTQTITFDEMKAIVDAAHALGHKVAIHSYGPSASRTPSAPAPTRSSTASTWTMRRWRRWRARDRLGADDRSQPVLRGREG